MADETASISLELDADDFDSVLAKTFDSLESFGKTAADILKAAGTTVDTALGGPLDRIAAKVKGVTSGIAETTTGWADKISGVAGGVSAKASGLMASLQEGLDPQALGTAALSSTGQAIGTMIGGPAGAAVGQLIGSALADNIDFASVLSDVQSLADGISEAAGGVGTFWDNTQQDLRDFFSDTRESFKALNLGDLFAGDVNAGLQKLEDFGGKILNSLADKLGLFIGRVANMADNLWAAIREPFARLADYVEKILVKIGILPEATGRWGDAIRSIESISTAVFKGIGYGIGLLETYYTKLGGYVVRYVVTPMITGVTTIIEFVTKAFAMVARNIGGAVGRAADETSKSLKTLNDALKAKQADFDKFAKRASDMGWTDKANKYAADFEGMMGGFKKKAAETDAAIMAMRQAQFDYLKQNFLAVTDSIKAGAEEAWAVLKNIPAAPALKVLAPTMTEGSSAAMNAINQFRSGGDTAAEQQRRLAEKQAQEAEKTRKQVEELNKKQQKLNDWLMRLEAI